MLHRRPQDLGIHRNTLLPRIARINELLDLDEKDGMECEGILLAMEIEKLKMTDTLGIGHFFKFINISFKD